MSEKITRARTQECLQAAAADEVVAIGGIASAAAECGISEDSIRRRLAGSHGWSAADLAALIAAGQAVLGRSLISQRLTMLLAADGHVAGDRRQACGHAGSALGSILGAAQVMGQALVDGKVDRNEARELLKTLPETIVRLDRLMADLKDLLRDPS